MTPAPHGVTEIESEGRRRGGMLAPSRQNNSLATSLCGLSVSLAEKYVCFRPGGRRNMSLFCFVVFFFV